MGGGRGNNSTSTSFKRKNLERKEGGKEGGREKIKEVRKKVNKSSHQHFQDVLAL